MWVATGGSAIMAIKELVARGVPANKIIFVNLVSCPEGLQALFTAHPQVRVVTAAIDEGLDARSYIVPGLGDFGDRYYGTQP